MSPRSPESGESPARDFEIRIALALGAICGGLIGPDAYVVGVAVIGVAIVIRLYQERKRYD